MIRLFTALSIPDDVADTLERRQSGLPGAKWRTRDQLHLTLAFYGEVEERRADDLAAELNRAAGRPSEMTDELIAASAHVHGLTVVTRNVRHFEHSGCRVLSPWSA